MSRGFHEQVNTMLRTAMADLIGRPQGGWVLLGCITDDDGLTGWEHLPVLNGALQAAFDARAASEQVTYRSIFDATADLAADLPPDAAAGGEGRLRGIALVCVIDDSEHGRVCIADAAFDDAWTHTACWEAETAAPSWAVLAPPDRIAPETSAQGALQALLAAVLRTAGHGARVVGENQQSLSVCLRDFIAEMTANGCHAVFVIVRTKDGWDAIPANDLAATVGAAMHAGADLACAVGMLADELRKDPPATIPTLQGVGTVVHYDHDDGTTETQLIAVGDAFLHAASWPHGHARPDWQILPIAEAEADTEYAPIAAAYTRLLTTIRGTHP